MKHYEITFKDILSAFYYHWRTIIVTTLVFFIFGAGFGFILFRSGDVLPNNSVAEITPLNQEENVLSIKNTYTLAQKYLDALSKEPTLDKTQHQRVQGLKSELLRFKEEELKSFYLLDEFMSFLEYECDASLKEYPQVYEVQLAFEEWREAEHELFHQAKEESLKRQLELEERMNSIINSINLLARDIAEKNLLNITIFINNIETNLISDVKTYTVEIAHGHRINDAREAALAIVLFCSLSGVCVGAFAAVCKEAKKVKTKQEEAVL